MRPPGVELDLIPQLRVDIVLHAEQILLVDVPPHELVDQSAVQFVVALLRGSPQLRVGRQRL